MGPGDCHKSFVVNNCTQSRPNSFLIQIGFVIAYSACGMLSDIVFEPMMQKNGVLADSIGKVIGTGQGRGSGLMIILAGALMAALELVPGSRKSIREIEVINYEYELKNVTERF